MKILISISFHISKHRLTLLKKTKVLDDSKVTLRDLKLIALGDPRKEISIGLIFNTSPENYLDLVNKAIDYVASEFSLTPKERKGRSEDGLTIDVISILKSLVFNVSHDTTVGGHCDIVIQEKFDFLWLGEAKIHKSYDWLLQGFNQLDTRYATATTNQNHGGLIIYCYNMRSDQVMEKWAAFLAENRTDVTVTKDTSDKSIIYSKHIHKRTGNEYTVRHKIISLYFYPKD